MSSKQKVSKSALILSGLCLLAACSKSSSVAPTVPSLAQGPEVNGQIVPRGTSQLLPGPSDSTINVANIGRTSDRFYVEVEAALSPDSFTKIKSSTGVEGLKATLAGSMAKLKKIGAIEIDETAEVGYVTFWLPYQRDMFAALKKVSLPAETYVNPISYDVNSLKQIKAFTASSLGFTPRGDTTGFSGLNLIHAPEFVALAESSMPGVKVDGSSVRLGITDTGITYRHPTLQDSNGKPRVIYMKDFTREGRMYFNPAAKFAATVTDETKNEFNVTADYLETETLPALPDPEAFKTITDKKVVVSDELKAILKDTAKYKVLLSLLREDTLQSEEDAVDLNGNGTVDDEVPALLVIDTTSGDVRVFADFTATYNFKNAVGLHNFNSSKETTKVFAESIGFHIQNDALVKSDSDDQVAVVSASMMGYDAGNHGTHVAGIAAGRKTISNDSDDTLARGVAPNAQILMDRVCANNGGCNASRAIIDMAQNGKAEVINMSLGGLSPFNDGYGVQETIVNRMTSVYNVLFMISAGNSGPGRQTVGSPSVAKLSLSIGAAASRAQIQRQYQWPGAGALNPASAEEDEFMLYFSSRGPTAAGGFKPNVSAPGTELSSVQLNAAPGGRAGLDIYWGTSMAAPTATGAYALLLDAIKKFNTLNPASPLTTDAMTLRNVIIQTARPFSKSQFTWMDEGTGMIDLVAAWKAVLALRAEKFSSGVADAAGNNLNLEYDIITSIKNPSGTAYDGTRVAADDAGVKFPEFGTGLYLNASDAGSNYSVYIGRHLTEADAARADAGDLTVGLVTSAEEFVLKTDFGNDAPWLRAGVLDQADCTLSVSDTSNLRVIGRGAVIAKKPDGTGSINPFGASTMVICVDRAKLAALPAGDHGALIYAYRTDGTTTATVPSFVVPVSITTPMKSMVDSTSYEVSSTVKSFQVARNYINVPKGVQALRVTLEVPEKKPNELCSAAELMSLEGGNTAAPTEDPATLRALSCDPTGAPIADPKKRVMTLNRTHPNAGIWELNIFGSYRYAESKYRLKVEYMMADTSVSKIEGDLSALTGSFVWKLKEGSITTGPDAAASNFSLSGLYHKEASQVDQDAQVLVDGPLGKLRSYPAGVKKVTITTGGSKGNDIDLDVIQCDSAAGAGCGLIGQSGGSTDEEKVAFAPKAGKFYAVRVTGYDIKDDGKFFSEETLTLAEEKGTLAVSPSGAGEFTVNYSFAPDQLQASKLLNSPLVTSHDYQVTGIVTLSTKDKVTVGAVPVTISL